MNDPLLALRSVPPTPAASPFDGVWLPIITPFDADDIDHAALARLARHYARAGIAGFVAGATSGEGALLTLAEQEALFVTLRRAVPDLPVVLGLSQPSTAVAVAQARVLAALAPDGLLVTPPTYLRPTQDGLRRHFEAIVDAADRPLLVYNIPYRTGVSVEIATLQQLERDTRVVGIKECGGSDERLLQLVEQTRLRVLSGDDHQNFVAHCLGAHGAITAAAHLLPQAHVRLRALLLQGRLGEARRIAVALQPLIADLFAEPNPAPIKAMLARDGHCRDELRLPFVPVTSALRERLARRLDALREAGMDQAVPVLDGGEGDPGPG